MSLIATKLRKTLPGSCNACGVHTYMYVFCIVAPIKKDRETVATRTGCSQIVETLPRGATNLRALSTV